MQTFADAEKCVLACRPSARSTLHAEPHMFRETVSVTVTFIIQRVSYCRSLLFTVSPNCQLFKETENRYIMFKCQGWVRTPRGPWPYGKDGDQFLSDHGNRYDRQTINKILTTFL